MTIRQSESEALAEHHCTGDVKEARRGETAGAFLRRVVVVGRLFGEYQERAKHAMHCSKSTLLPNASTSWARLGGEGVQLRREIFQALLAFCRCGPHELLSFLYLTDLQTPRCRWRDKLSLPISFRGSHIVCKRRSRSSAMLFAADKSDSGNEDARN